MVWEHLDVNQPHLVYLVLGGFTTLFMLCSSVIKERFYIGEATVATICGIIFGPHAANVINPLEWGNTDQITLEFARIVLVVQCFAVGVELPKAYMERHWRSVVLLLVPVMTFGWLITSLFIWWLFMNRLDWLDSLCVAACVTATDPVLASSVVGKGKFAKRVPKHLRDLLSAESGCNDGMAFPFVYLAVYIIRYRPDANTVSLHWFCYTILYECVFGAFYGVVVGYLARRGIRYAHEHKLIDRESFLVFYFVLALFCAGSGSILGIDDLLVGFAAGVGFSNDGWFQEKTEETHVSNVIDLLINLAFFVYFGTIIPWASYNSAIIGIAPWQLVVLSIFVILFRRIPIMVMLKPIIPDIKTWREALFAGHFGPIGVGALFVAILARAELETESTTPLAVLPPPDFPHDNIIELIWPITTFLVIVSIIIHGSSVAVFTLGKHINTLTITMSYTQMNEDGPSWMDRLPRIQSRSKSSMAKDRGDDTDSLYDEKLSGPDGLPVNFLRRQKEGDNSSRSSSRRARRRKKWDHGIGPGGPISQSAIAPQRRKLDTEESRTDSETLAPDSNDQSPTKEKKDPSRESDEEPEEEIYEEGGKDVIEDEEGNVLRVEDSRPDETSEDHDNRLRREATELGKKKHGHHGKSHEREDGEEAEDGEDADEDELERMGSAIKEGVENIPTTWKGMRKRMETGFGGLRRMGSHVDGAPKPEKAEPSKQKRGAALAYQFGNTIIVEDEDGEVLKKYDIPTNKPRPNYTDRQGTADAGQGQGTMQKLARMGSYFGFQHGGEGAESGPSRGEVKRKYSQKINEGEDDDDRHIRFTLGAGGRRMSKNEFIEQIQKMDPRARATLVENSDAPEPLKKEVRQDAREHHARVGARQDSEQQARRPKAVGPHASRAGSEAQVRKVPSHEDQETGPNGLTLVDSDLDKEIPFHDVHDDLDEVSFGQGGKETGAAARRRRLASGRSSEAATGKTEDGGRAEKAARVTRGRAESSSYFGSGGHTGSSTRAQDNITPDEDDDDQEETVAERRRRQEVLGEVAEGEEESESEEEIGTGFRNLSRTPTTNSLGRNPSNREAPRSSARQASSLATVQEAAQRAASGVRQPEPSYQSSSTEQSGPRMSIRFADGVRREGEKTETQSNQEDVSTDNSTRRSRLRWSDLKRRH